MANQKYRISASKFFFIGEDATSQLKAFDNNDYANYAIRSAFDFEPKDNIAKYIDEIAEIIEQEVQEEASRHPFIG